MSDLRLDIRERDGVAEVVFERRGVLNALAPDHLPRLASAMDEAGRRPGARVVVLRGAGGAFSAGDDLKATARLDRDGWRGVVEGFHELTRVARALDVPVICAIDGVCVGGAFEFACSCDLRVATTRSRFGCPEVAIGITVSNASSLLLAYLCGTGYAAELMLTGRIVDAQEALEHGLVHAVVEPKDLDEKVRALAAEIAARAPLAVTATKRLIVAAQAASVREAMERETTALLSLWETADFREGLTAFAEKRKPFFSGS